MTGVSPGGYLSRPAFPTLIVVSGLMSPMAGRRMLPRCRRPRLLLLVFLTFFVPSVRSLLPTRFLAARKPATLPSRTRRAMDRGECGGRGAFSAGGSLSRILMYAPVARAQALTGTGEGGRDVEGLWGRHRSLIAAHCSAWGHARLSPWRPLPPRFNETEHDARPQHGVREASFS